MTLDKLCYSLLRLSIKGLPNARLSPSSWTVSQTNFSSLSAVSTRGTQFTSVTSSDAILTDNHLQMISGGASILPLVTKCHREYICPSIESTRLPPAIILDIANSVVGFYDCPNILERYSEFIAPPNRNLTKNTPPSEKAPEKQAQNLLKIRRRKMNRHLLKKFRKRMKFTLRKQRLQSRRKKEKAFRMVLDKFKIQSEAFDAEQHIKEQLVLAKKGGYKVDIFNAR